MSSATRSHEPNGRDHHGARDPLAWKRFEGDRGGRAGGLGIDGLRVGPGEPEDGNRRARRRGGGRPDRGVIGGALVGGLAGNLLDQRDRRLANEAAQQAFETAPSGKAVAWTNPDSGHSGTITPVRTYQSNGRYCREFQQTVTIGGRPENSFGTACRMPDGAWQIVS
jgi:surface antigen